MVDPDASQELKNLSIATIVVAVWLILSPFILGYTDVSHALWTSFIAALVAAWIAGLRVSGGVRQPWLSGVSALIGVWLIASPWVWDFSGELRVLINDIVVGVILIGLGALSARAGAAHA